MNRPDVTKGPDTADAAFLRVRDLEKHFGGLPAIAGLDLDVPAGEILAVIGPNGAGKSTLLKMIGGVVAPSHAGGIWLQGRDLTGLRPHSIRHRGVAQVQQTPQLFHGLTVLENVVVGALFGRRRRPGQAEALRTSRAQLERLGLDGCADHAVGVLDLHHRRLVEFARAMVAGPRLLLLDEIMAGLGPHEIQSWVARIRAARDHDGVTVVWVEHVMAAVEELADRVLVLDFGRQLAQGRPREVLRDPSVVRAYLGEGG